MNSNISINFQKKIKLDKKKIIKFASNLSKRYNKKISNIELNFVDIETIIKINASFLNHNYATDIITFDYREKEDDAINCEIFICPDVAMENAKKYKVTFEEEIFRLVAHGILHSLGYEDETKSQKITMRKKEKEALSLFYYEQNKSGL